MRCPLKAYVLVPYPAPFPTAPPRPPADPSHQVHQVYLLKYITYISSFTWLFDLLLKIVLVYGPQFILQ